MNPRAFLLVFFLNSGYCTLNAAEAKDFGVHGHTFEIEEPDLLKAMEGKLKRLEAQGKLEGINEGILKRAQSALAHPKPVEGITKAEDGREFFYDPTIVVPYDLKDHEGKIFHKTGTRLNPLEFRSLPAPLVFMDSEDKDQVAWVERVYLKKGLKTNQHLKIILTSGSPFELMEQWNQPTYFDQGGVLTEKLGIRHVPAVVVQAGLKLKISEIVVEEKVLEGDKP